MPAPLAILNMMQRKRLSKDSPRIFQLFHPRYAGFKDALKQVRDRVSDNLVSIARIPLPFAVQIRIDQKCNLAWRDSAAKMIRVEVKTFVELYSVVNDEKYFEVC